MLTPVDDATQARVGAATTYCAGKLRDLALGIEDALDKNQGDIIITRPHAALIYRAMMDHADLMERYL